MDGRFLLGVHDHVTALSTIQRVMVQRVMVAVWFNWWREAN
jgi:hypothetical protein